ncbi:MAG: O-antigen ligase family protein, partial [Planctomycetota bacterium]
MNNLQQKNKIDLTIEGLLYALLAFMPLAFGSVQAWSEEVVIILSVAITICFAVKLVSNRQFKFVWTWAYLPVAVFILIVVFQLIPLSVAFVDTISPNTARLKTELFSYLPNSDTLLGSMPLSFYPHATLTQLRLLLALASIFVVITNYFNTADKIKRLLFAIALIGGCVSLIAIAQIITSSEKIYWIIQTPHKIADAGPFVNHSNYGQFMNLSIGAALGLFLVMLHEFFYNKRFSADLLGQFFDSKPGKRSWLLFSIIIMGMASIFASLSRGGMISMLIAMAFIILLLTRRNTVRGRGWLMVVMALAAFSCVLYIGFDAVYDRLATLRDLHHAQSGRIQILKDIALAWTKFPLFGTGLGTHEVVYPMFDRSTIAALAAHAENEYAQAAEETGILGL